MYKINENIINLNYDLIVSYKEESKAIYKIKIILTNIKLIINEINTIFVKSSPKNSIINLLQNIFENLEKYCVEDTI